MGLLGKLFGGDGGVPGGVRGVAQVVSATGYHEGVMAMCHMQLVLSADGVPPTAVAFKGLVHNKRWPHPGMTLPVSLDPSDPTRYKILWDEVERSDRRAQRSAEQLAEAMRGGGGGGLAGLGGANVNVVNLSGGRADRGAAREAAHARARPGGGRGRRAHAEAPAAGGEDDDTLGRLERLAALKAQGLLTDEEFAEQKRRILDA